MYNSGIAARLDALGEAVERRRMEQAAPIDELSRSLWEYGAELAALDDLGIIAEAAALDIDTAGVRMLVDSLAPPVFLNPRRSTL